MIVGFAEMIVISFIVLGVTVYYLVPMMRRRAELLDKPKREVRVGDDGEIITIGERERSKSFSRSGKGSYASDALPLFAGVYRLEYRFPEAAPVAVTLIHIDAAEETPILIKAGAGSHAFRIEATGRYVLEVEPTDSVLSWEVAFRQL